MSDAEREPTGDGTTNKEAVYRERMLVTLTRANAIIDRVEAELRSAASWPAGTLTRQLELHAEDLGAARRILGHVYLSLENKLCPIG